MAAGTLTQEQRALVHQYGRTLQGDAVVAFEGAVCSRLEAFMDSGIVQTITAQQVAAACAQELAEALQ